MDGRMWKNVKDKSVVKNLKAITSFEELEKVLKYIQNMQSENIRTLVFLYITVPAVTNSAFYNTGFWDAFIGYNHLSGSAYKSGNKINFTANGEIILKIIWQGVELKRLPTNSSGYYDTNQKIYG